MNIYSHNECLLKSIIEAYYDKSGPLQKEININDISENWNAADFSENLIIVLSSSISERSFNIIMRHSKGESFRTIADDYKISGARTAQIYKKTIYDLATEDVLHKIKVGLINAEKEEAASIKESTERKLNQLEGKIANLFEKGLSVRAANVIYRRLGTGIPKEVALTRLQKLEYETDISDFPNCGKTTAEEIIICFQSLGLDTSNWEKCFLNGYMGTKHYVFEK